MTEITIKKSNKLIAAYLGYKTDDYWWYHEDHDYEPMNENTCQYHEQWGWIMSVYQYILSEKKSVGSEKARQCMDGIIAGLLKADLQKVYSYIVSYVKEKNKQTS